MGLCYRGPTRYISLLDVQQFNAPHHLAVSPSTSRLPNPSKRSIIINRKPSSCNSVPHMFKAERVKGVWVCFISTSTHVVPEHYHCRNHGPEPPIITWKKPPGISPEAAQIERHHKPVGMLVIHIRLFHLSDIVIPAAASAAAIDRSTL